MRFDEEFVVQGVLCSSKKPPLLLLLAEFWLTTCRQVKTSLTAKSRQVWWRVSEAPSDSHDSSWFKFQDAFDSQRPLVAARSLLANFILHPLKIKCHLWRACDMQVQSNMACATCSAVFVLQYPLSPSPTNQSVFGVLWDSVFVAASVHVPTVFEFPVCSQQVAEVAKLPLADLLLRCTCRRKGPYPEHFETVTNCLFIQPNILKSFELPSDRLACRAIFVPFPVNASDDFLCNAWAHATTRGSASEVSLCFCNCGSPCHRTGRLGLQFSGNPEV